MKATICVLLALLGTIAMGQDDRGNRPPRPGGPGGGHQAMPENKTPTSPNPGQTVGLFLNTPDAFNGYTLFAPKHNNVIYLMDNQGRITVTPRIPFSRLNAIPAKYFTYRVAVPPSNRTTSNSSCSRVTLRAISKSPP